MYQSTVDRPPQVAVELGRAVWTGRTGTGLSLSLSGEMMVEGFGLDGVVSSLAGGGVGCNWVPLKFGGLAGLAWPNRKRARSAGGEIWEEPGVGMMVLDQK